MLSFVCFRWCCLFGCDLGCLVVFGFLWLAKFVALVIVYLDIVCAVDGSGC